MMEGVLSLVTSFVSQVHVDNHGWHGLQYKCHVPHVHGNPKSWDNAAKLKSQFGGFIIHGVGSRIFVFEEGLNKDANLWTTLFVRALVEEKQRREEAGHQWPKVLYLQVDNGPDNKNKELFMVGELLVRLGIFAKVKFSFLPVGHTHEDIDAMFGAGSHLLHHRDCCTMAEVFEQFKKGWPSMKRFDYVAVSLSVVVVTFVPIFVLRELV